MHNGMLSMEAIPGSIPVRVANSNIRSDSESGIP